MRNGKKWTYWQLQETIKEKANKFYSENSIGAAVRDLRKMPERKKYNLNTNMAFNTVKKEAITGGKGYTYRLVEKGFEE